MLKRTIQPAIEADLGEKVILLSGPRQCGKTTLSRSIHSDCEYLNWDSADDRKILREMSWNRKSPLLVLDEIHKMPKWKQFLKGVYDKEGLKPPILVTGSARLDIAKKMGDSLAGRFFAYRLLPLDIKELAGQMASKEVFDRLMRVGGFPEPFTKNSETFYRRWRSSHSDIILKQDLLTVESLKDIDGLETLISLLRSRVGSGVSNLSLARDLERDPKTIQRWLIALENLFVIFRVTPHSKNIARAKQKEPKFYFYDLGMVEGDNGARFENLVALSLLKELHLQHDTEGLKKSLHYLRTRDGKEIDFVITDGKQVTHLIETKWSDSSFHRPFEWIQKYYSKAKKIQLIAELDREKTFPNGVEVTSAVEWLRTVEI